jgi:hypothetical protein
LTQKLIPQLLRSQNLNLTQERDGHQGQGEERGREMDGDKEGMTWVMGADEEDNKIYKKFLSYCEERREDLRLRVEADE